MEPVPTSIVRLPLVARIEAVSYLVLMVAVVVKYAGDEPVGVSVLGPIHGVIVLGYAAMLVLHRDLLGWTWERVLTAIVLGAVPLGGFWVERQWLEPLAASWVSRADLDASP